MKTLQRKAIAKNTLSSMGKADRSKKEFTSAAFIELAHQLGQEFEKRASEYDQNDRFVSENYARLKEHRIFTALVPAELGGLGQSHSDICHFLRILGSYCGSTALALSMHQHLIGVNTWKYLHQKGGEAILEKVARNQIVLISTGARDWLESNGELKKVKGGYLLNAYKAFASQSVEGDVFVTSAPFHDPENGPQVFHFSVPASAKGVKILDNWYAMGMRATGSHSAVFEEVFIPDEAIALHRPQGEPHQVYNIVLTVAMPLIMSVYTGIAEKATQMAINSVKKNPNSSAYLPQIIGELNNLLVNTQVVNEDMVRLCNDFDFAPSHELGHAMLSRKVIVAKSAIQTVSKAMEVVGGQGFFRKFGLEKLFRDIQGAHYHPLPEKDQQQFTGTFLLQE